MHQHNLFSAASLSEFLKELDAEGMFCILKRLSRNDTSQTGSHQAGIYLPKVFCERVFGEICTTADHNPDIFITCTFPQINHTIAELRVVYYNSKYFPQLGLRKPYDEFRVTRWGRSSPLQDPENTGSILIFAVRNGIDGEKTATVWVSKDAAEEIEIESWLGEEVEPMRPYIRQQRNPIQEIEADAELDVPPDWYQIFPTSDQIFNHVLQLTPRSKSTSPDRILLHRRDLEFKLFQQIEHHHLLPKISGGFQSVEEFNQLSLSVANRRKARTGKSLENHLQSIFKEEKLVFQTQVPTERTVTDFIFPSAKAYQATSFPSYRLQMLAAKTTCKDRWRQVVAEAQRISTKHLFTLQQGVSDNQLNDMYGKGIVLVIPAPLKTSYPANWRNDLLTLKDFIELIRHQQQATPQLNKWIP